MRGKTKINERRSPYIATDDIRGLDISVENPDAMQNCELVRNLGERRKRAPRLTDKDFVEARSQNELA